MSGNCCKACVIAAGPLLDSIPGAEKRPFSAYSPATAAAS
jgi:hypothetical protein